MEIFMPRIQPTQNPSPKAQEQLAAVKKMLGSTPNIFTTFAHSPAVLGFYLAGSGALAESSISGGLREQIALTVAGANHCDYCASAHTALGKMQKLAEGELAQNLNAKSADSKTQAALTFARKLVDLRGNVSDEDVKAVRDAGFTDGEVLEIVAVTSLNIFTNYFNHVAGTEIDFPLVATSNVAKAA